MTSERKPLYDARMNTNEVTLHTYSVFYRVVSGDERAVIVEAIDAVDAKHVAESLEGEVIVVALARKVRKVR